MITSNLLKLVEPDTLESFVEYLVPALPLEPVKIKYTSDAKLACHVWFYMQVENQLVPLCIWVGWGVNMAALEIGHDSYSYYRISLKDPYEALDYLVIQLQQLLDNPHYIKSKLPKFFKL